MHTGTYFQTLTGSCGRWLLGKVSRLSDLLGFFVVCLKTVLRHWRTGPRVMIRTFVQQIYFTGVQSLELTCFIALLVGGMVVIQGVAQSTRVGSREVLPTLLTVVIIRELGPLLTAVIVTLRSGSAIAIEMGYMTVLREIESIEMQGINPLHFLAFPRLIGVSVSVLCLFVFFDVVSIFGGFIAAWALVDVPMWNLFSDLARAVSGADFIVGSVKALFFGLTISLVCLYHGFRAHEAVTSIPPQVSQALVDCFIFCFFFNVLISAVFYL
ncbi:MAG: ABC transporter permease [Deltaproteobacteria bacterium]|nr:MAG: ABC transporter permease [Deltaproteobacteria bacterium]